MLTVTGRWLSQFEIKENKLFSTGVIQQMDKSANDIQRNIARMMTCIDWYLVTTYYWSDGTTTQTEVYVGTTCSGCDDPYILSFCPDNGGGGNGGPDRIENGQDNASVTSSVPVLDPNTGETNASGSVIPIIFHALCGWSFNHTQGRFEYINQYKPYPVPVSQVFTDDNGNPATLTAGVGVWSATKTPLTIKGVLVQWTFIATRTYTYTTGVRGPFTFTEGISKVIGPL